MRYITDRKRAEGHGSARAGTDHFWRLQLSSVALAVLIPLFLLTFGRILGASHAEVAAYFARPFPAVVAGLTLVVGFLHYKDGVQVVIEDYSNGRCGRFCCWPRSGSAMPASPWGCSR